VPAPGSDEVTGRDLVKLRHVVSTVVLTLLLGSVFASAASAQYPPTVGAGRVSRSQLMQCQCTLFTGGGFQPGSAVTIVDQYPDGTEHVVATVVADKKGDFKRKVCFDQNAPQGQHTLIARGVDANGGAHEDRATVTVKGSICFRRGDEVHGDRFQREDPPGGAGGLPRTGTDLILPGLLVGTALVVAGSGVVYVVRRRRHAPAAA
jgi:LPXTG-motif cell wall-anchored protein